MNRIKMRRKMIDITIALPSTEDRGQERRKVMGKEKWKKVGVVGVDSGKLMLWDPCYHKQKQTRWENMDSLLEKASFPTKLQLNFDLGHAGAGFIVSTGLGDGVYDVEVLEGDVERWGDRILGVRVMFIPHPVLGTSSPEELQRRKK
jgi:hypothetical protein